ncbi:MAG: sn-glycerol-3-phosphate ABC transporter ATP-binding protein UgpC [Magnetococcales bacterium]|nr:sn-glycerol-3-phosphate ABC transporter ATP-binding protein UgpC [Magnetococcales bacterium]
MPKNSLVLRSVGKTYGKNISAVKNIDAEIADGEFVVIVGPSGCGKSTLLRMVAGLETVTSGDIFIGETLVNNLEPAQRDVAMVFQNYALYPHMSVFDNMAYALKIRGLAKKEIKQRVSEVAKILELEPLLQRRPKALSGGQRQRVAMGRCIIRNPKLFLFDEPLSNLDTKLRHQMRLELKKLHHRLKTTSLYVTHDQVEAMTLGDRLIVMNQGRAEQIGTPIAIYQNPATKFVAGFIGSPGMNFLQATITNSGKTADCQGLGQLQLPDSGLVGYNGKNVIMGIRPEHIVVETAIKSGFNLPVILVETLGADSLIHCEAETPPQPAITIRLTGTHQFNIGEQIYFSFPQDKLHLFDGESGANLNQIINKK